MTDAAWRFDAIGTSWEIVAPAPLGDGRRRAVTETIDRFDAEWSRFRADSLVSRLGARGGQAPAPADALAMLDLYAELSLATDGAVNPLAGESLERLGYDAAYSLRSSGEPLAAPARWRDRMTWRDGALRIEGTAVVDVGALGKGRLVDRVADLIPDAVAIDAGGDIRIGSKPQRIALEHPYDARRAIGAVTVRDEALCASSSNRRAWGDGLHHVIDARTGVPVRTIVASWAIAMDAMTADAAATALFFDGGPRFAKDHGVHWVRMHSDGRAEWSLGERIEKGEAELFR